VRLVESSVDVREVVHGADEETRADHENHCQCDFGHHQASAQVMPCPTGGAFGAAFRERNGETFPADLAKLRQSEEQAGGHGDASDEQQHGQIDADLGRSGQSCGVRLRHRVDTDAREPQRQCAPGDGQQRAFGDELPEETGAARAKGGADREFTTAYCRTRQ
jgi:hypothetical protein